MKEKILKLSVITMIILFVVGIGFAVFKFGTFNLAGACGNEVLNRSSSPDGKHTAVTFKRDCGATTGFSTQVSILPANKSLLMMRAGMYLSVTRIMAKLRQAQAVARR